jgi:hypothetical protein
MECFIARFPHLVGVHVEHLKDWAKPRCKEFRFQQEENHILMGGIFMVPPVCKTKIYNSFAMLLRRKKIPRGQLSQQGKFKLVEPAEYESVFGPSPLLAHRRNLIEIVRAERIRKACEKLDRLRLLLLERAFAALAEPITNRRREHVLMDREDRRSKRMRTFLNGP